MIQPCFFIQGLQFLIQKGYLGEYLITSMATKKDISQTMKQIPAIKLPLHAVAIGLLMSLGACNSDSGTGPEIHDTKYVALNSDGEQLDAGQTGPCVLDQFIGLVWEVKTSTSGLHDWNNTYTWFNPDETVGEELDYRGKPDGGECSGSACDTTALVEAVNATGYCGFNDWRMPTRDELGSISDPRKSRTPPSITTKATMGITKSPKAEM